MRTGLLVGFLLKYIIALLPVLLIIFSKLVSGKTKVKWALAALLIPYILKEIVYVVVMFQGDALQMYGPIVLGGWAPAIPLTWYISAWSIYFYFKIKYESPKIQKQTKIIAGIILTILVAVLFLTGRDNSGSKNRTKYISASACAKRLSNGEIVDCTPSELNEKQQTSALYKIMEIDEENPGPKQPDILTLGNIQLFNVKEISSNGIILLDNGLKLKLAGLECRNEEAVKYLRAVFLNKDASKLAYSLTGYTEAQYKYAYVWEIGLLNKPDYGPTLSSSNETLITIGWCKPIKQEKHLYHLRYKRFEELANEL